MDKERDPIVEIDMQDSANFHRAIQLALESADTCSFGEMPTPWLHELSGTSEKLWTTWCESKEGSLVVAITGNGPKSSANAEFFASARKVVLGLVSEVDRLKTIVRNLGGTP